MTTSPSPAPTAPKFVGGKQNDLGTVNRAAASPKANDPERFVPKKTMADGATPKKGKKVVLKRGDAPAVIVETYQVAAQVRLEDDSSKTVAYSQMSLLKPSA